MQSPLSQPQRTWWFPAAALALVVALTWAPLVAAGVTAADSGTPESARAFTPGVADLGTMAKIADSDEDSASALASALPKRAAPLPKPKPQAATTSSRRTASQSVARSVRAAGSRVARPASSSKTGATVKAAKRTTKKSASTGTPSTKSGGSNKSAGSELSQARAILASLISQHPILAGTTVSIGATPGGYQAVAYFKSGRILISPTHKASLRTILRHEIWHVIDWRDNHKIDWGENVPPR